MEFRSFESDNAKETVGLFDAAFSASDGEQEGAVVAGLVGELIASTDSRDLYGFTAVDRGRIVGAIFFSRLTFDQPLEAFILSPVAVHPDRQGEGIGQALISHGLRELARNGVSFVATYGDPGFYAKVGFQPVSKDVIKPPHALSQPEGWLGQSLTGESLETVSGRCSCVKALDNPVIW